jgi:hypothetical protein
MANTPTAIENLRAIIPDVYYPLEKAQSILCLTQSSLPRQIKLGKLQAVKRCGKYYVKGEWLLAWLNA